MGGVLAASPPPPPPGAGSSASLGLTVPPGFGMPSVTSAVPPTGETRETLGQQLEVEKPLTNPGEFDECHRKCKGGWSQTGVCKYQAENLKVGGANQTT